MYLRAIDDFTFRNMSKNIPYDVIFWNNDVPENRWSCWRERGEVVCAALLVTLRRAYENTDDKFYSYNFWTKLPTEFHHFLWTMAANQLFI